jgi:hypothetical protein
MEELQIEQPVEQSASDIQLSALSCQLSVIPSNVKFIWEEHERTSFVSGYRFSDTTTFRKQRPFRGWMR